jgi:hypothetical protein
MGVDGHGLPVRGTVSASLCSAPGSAAASVKRVWAGASLQKISTGGRVPISARKSLRISPPKHRFLPPCISTTWEPRKSPAPSQLGFQIVP